MIYLLLSIISSGLLVVIFKLFEKFSVHTFYGIVINYLTAAALGCFLIPASAHSTVWDQSWLYHALFLGVFFIATFYLLGLTSQKLGVSIAALANKMSLVIPVLLGFLIYKDPVSILKIAGILLALVAVYFVSVKKEKSTIDKKYLLLPLVVFFGSGIIDSTIKYVEKFHVFNDTETNFFITYIFIIAFVTGFLISVYKIVWKKETINRATIFGGIVLGIANYGSMFYLMKALEQMESSTLFPINNIGVITFASIVAIVFLKEKISLKNWVGIGIAILSITLIALS